MADKFVLNRDVEVLFQGLHTVRAKKGARVAPIKCGGGEIAYALQVYETDSPTGKGTLFNHDITYYYIWAPKDSVEKVEG